MPDTVFVWTVRDVVGVVILAALCCVAIACFVLDVCEGIAHWWRNKR